MKNNSESRSDSAAQDRGSGNPKIQHTNAGSTGTGSGQISPITHNLQVPSKTPGGPRSGTSGSDRDR